MNRFFVNKKNINDNKIVITDKEDIKHLSKVLRIKPGEKIEISDGEEYEYIAEVDNISNNHIEAEIKEKSHFNREPAVKITLYQGIPKQGKMEYIIQKSVELGVSEIVPIFTERTIVQNKGNFDNKTERWQKIALEAAKQCKRGIIPKVNEALPYKEMLEDMANKDLVLFLYEGEMERKIKTVLQNNCDAKQAAIIVGPEGGFSDSEVLLASDRGFLSVTLGKTILRTETAGAVAIALLLYELEG